MEGGSASFASRGAGLQLSDDGLLSPLWQVKIWYKNGRF